MLGSNTGYLDSTIFRNGSNLAVQLGNLNDSGDWNIDEWFTFEGNNYVSVGTINTQTANIQGSGFPDPNNERPVNFNGLNTINGISDCRAKGQGSASGSEALTPRVPPWQSGTEKDSHRR